MTQPYRRRRWNPKFRQCFACYSAGLSYRESVRVCGVCLLREKKRLPSTL